MPAEQSAAAYISPIGLLAMTAVRYFAEQDAAFQVLECGKGAQFDDVNRVPHAYALIGTIFAEHTRELGATAADIARDKAHVITAETRYAYCAAQEPEVAAILRARAARVGCRFKMYGVDFGDAPYPLSLAGDFQRMHAGMAIEAARDILADKLPEEAVLADALRSVSIEGRMEILSERPFLMIDSCINRRSAREVVRLLREKRLSGVTTILCLPDDKDLVGVAEVMQAVSDKIFLSKIHHPHYPMTVDQGRQLAEAGIVAECETDFKNALSGALTLHRPIVILCANTFVYIIKDFVNNSKGFCDYS